MDNGRWFAIVPHFKRYQGPVKARAMTAASRFEIKNDCFRNLKLFSIQRTPYMSQTFRDIQDILDEMQERSVSG